MQTQAQHPQRFLKLAEVKQRTTLSTSEIYRRLETNNFPAQIRLGARAVVWLESEIQAWMDEQISQRGA